MAEWIYLRSRREPWGRGVGSLPHDRSRGGLAADTRHGAELVAARGPRRRRRPAAAARAARPRHRRRRDHRRGVHRPLDGVVPARAQPRGAHRAAGAGHLRRRAERPERRLPPRLVGGRADARPSLRRRGGGCDRARRGRGRRRHRRVVCNARRRRLVREARLPARQRLSRPSERLGWDAGGAGAARPRRRAHAAPRSRGPARLRLTGVRRRAPHAERGIGPARAPRPRPATRAARARRPDRGGHARAAGRRSRAAPRGHRGRQRHRQARRAGNQRLGRRLAGIPHPSPRLGVGHRADRADPRPSRRAGLDRRRAAQRLALHDQLFPHHGRRADRLRRRSGQRGLRRSHRSIRSRTTVARSHAWSPTSTTCCRCFATCA